MGRPWRRSLERRGINPHNIYSLTEARWPTKFPVFVRNANTHEGPRKLLRSRRELERTVALIDRRGIDRRDIIIGEFLETADAKGRYRSYGAFIVGDHIFPRSILCSRHWVAKGSVVSDQDILEEVEAYVFNLRGLPTEQLRAIFHLARVEYGRMDFVIHDGRLIVWEINTNPSIALLRPPGSFRRDHIRRRCSEYFDAAIRALLTD